MICDDWDGMVSEGPEQDLVVVTSASPDGGLGFTS